MKKLIAFAVAAISLASTAANIVLIGDYAKAVASACAEMRPDGHFGKRLDKMLANHVEATDPVKLAALYREETKGHWQTEFWGKYMHAAVPFWRYTGSERLGAKIAAGVQAILAVQEPGGYIGNYAPENRYSRGWDVWGTKYTLMGLLHYYDATGDAKTLEAAKRLCDYLIAERGPKGRTELRFTGGYGGLPSLSLSCGSTTARRSRASSRSRTTS